MSQKTKKSKGDAILDKRAHEAIVKQQNKLLLDLIVKEMMEKMPDKLQQKLVKLYASALYKQMSSVYNSPHRNEDPSLPFFGPGECTIVPKEGSFENYRRRMTPSLYRYPVCSDNAASHRARHTTPPVQVVTPSSDLKPNPTYEKASFRVFTGEPNDECVLCGKKFGNKLLMHCGYCVNRTHWKCMKRGKIELCPFCRNELRLKYN